MFTFNQFMTHLVDNAARMPQGELQSIRRAAKDRLTVQWQNGRADGVLLFDDLVERIEKSLGS